MTSATPEANRLDQTDTLLLTVEEAAQQLRIGRTRMYGLVTSGAVESIFVGRLRRVPIECLHAYVKSRLAKGRRHEKSAA